MFTPDVLRLDLVLGTNVCVTVGTAHYRCTSYWDVRSRSLNYIHIPEGLRNQ